MSTLRYVDISKHRPEVGDILVIQNSENIQDSLYAKIIEVKEDGDDKSVYLVQVMRTTRSFVAGTKFDHKLDRTAPVIGAVIPSEEREQTDLDVEVTVEELALFSLMTLIRPFAQQGKSVRIRSAIDYLRAHDIVSEEMSDVRVKKLIERAVALRPNKVQMSGGWLRMQHIAPNIATPQNHATVERVVDKRMLLKAVNEFVVGLCESGLLGPIAWKIE